MFRTRLHHGFRIVSTACAGAFLTASTAEIRCAPLDGDDDYNQVPKSALFAAAALTTGYLAWKMMPTEERKAKQEKDYSKVTSIISTLKDVIEATQRIIAETEKSQAHREALDPLPLGRMLVAAKTLKEAFESYAAADPLWFQQKVSELRLLEPTPTEIQTLAQFLPLALSAYSTQEDLEKECKERGLELLYHDATTDVGRTSHYVAVDHQFKRVIIAIKGTSDLNDALTDAVCRPLPLYKMVSQVAVGHEAMTNAAHQMKDRLGFLLKDLFEVKGYETVVTGHSLGAGTATLLAILLREELGIQHIRGIGFATPPVVDKITALKSTSYVTSMVHNQDVVPCASVGNLVTLNEGLVELDKVIQRDGQAKAAQVAFETLKCAVDSHKPTSKELFVPGKVCYAYHDGHGRYHGVVSDGTLPIIKTIQISSTMITDHLGDGYTAAVSGLVEGEKARK